MKKVEDRAATRCKIIGTGEIDSSSSMNATGEAYFDSSPDHAIEGLKTHEGPIYIDLDETLYLRNSTEDFIDSAQPGVVAVAMLQLLEFLRPWNWTGGHPTRDSWRVWVVRTWLP